MCICIYTKGQHQLFPNPLQTIQTIGTFNTPQLEPQPSQPQMTQSLQTNQPLECIELRNIIKDAACLANNKKMTIFSCYPNVCIISIVLRSQNPPQLCQSKYTMLLISTTLQQMTPFLPSTLLPEELNLLPSMILLLWNCRGARGRDFLLHFKHLITLIILIEIKITDGKICLKVY